MADIPVFCAAVLPHHIPDPGTRTHVVRSFSSVLCARRVVRGLTCYVELLPDSVVPSKHALSQADFYAALMGSGDVTVRGGEVVEC